MSGSTFRFVRTVGAVLTGDALAGAAELRMPGQTANDYQLPPGTTLNTAVARAWDTLLAAHRETVAKERAYREEEDEQAVLESIDAFIEDMRQRRFANEAILAEHKPEAGNVA